MKRSIFVLLIIAGSVAALYSSSIPAEEQLVRMQLNVKIACGLYSDFYDRWKLEVFYNIGESKSVHNQRMESILDKFSIAEPVNNERDAGLFEDSALQMNFDALIQNGSGSKMNAVITCAFLEEKIYKDLGECLKAVSGKESKEILRQMLIATGYHLKALVKTLNRSGKVYKPQLLTEIEFDKVLDPENAVVTSERD